MTRQRDPTVDTTPETISTHGQTIVDFCRTEEVSQTAFLISEKRFGDQAVYRFEDSPADAAPIPPANVQP